MKVIALLICLMLLSGCSPIEAYRQIVGTSTQRLEVCEPRFGQSFSKDYSSIYDLTIKFLKEKMKSEIFMKDFVGARIIAIGFTSVFISCLDTTEVGVFFSEPSPGSTSVEVASLNSALAKYVANELFKYLNQ